MDWSQLVRQWRTDSGLSLEAAGRLLGVAHTTIRNWERGRRPLDIHRYALCELLGVADTEQRPSPLRLSRVARGLSMGQLANKIHVSRATLSTWERRRRRPGAAYIPHLAHALNLSRQQVTKLFHGYPETGATGRVALPSLRQIRRGSGTSQRALATRLGVSVPTLYDWESGRNVVPVSILPSLTVALGVSVETLSMAVVAYPRTAANLTPLSKLRRRRGLTQRQAAARIGISVKQLAALEAGRQVLTFPTCLALARVYRCPFRQVASLGNLRIDPMMDRNRWSAGTLPAVLVFLRHQHGAPATTVAGQIGIRPATLRRWESGLGRPQQAPIGRLEAFYGLPQGELVKAMVVS